MALDAFHAPSEQIALNSARDAIRTRASRPGGRGVAEPPSFRRCSMRDVFVRDREDGAMSAIRIMTSQVDGMYDEALYRLHTSRHATLSQATAMGATDPFSADKLSEVMEMKDLLAGMSAADRDSVTLSSQALEASSDADASTDEFTNSSLISSGTSTTYSFDADEIEEDPATKSQIAFYFVSRGYTNQQSLVTGDQDRAVAGFNANTSISFDTGDESIHVDNLGTGRQVKGWFGDFNMAAVKQYAKELADNGLMPVQHHVEIEV